MLSQQLAPHDPSYLAADRVELLDDDVAPGADPGAWHVLIVDDDDDVHHSTELALRGLLIEGRRIEFSHARSARAARAVIERDQELAAVLLDVVMETPDAGLQLVREVREELNRLALRIILRTGQPGYAPELETIRSFDINDYRTKAELTQVRLFTSLTIAIRGYRQTLELTQARDELALLTASLLEARALELAEAERSVDAEEALEATGRRVDNEVVRRTETLSSLVVELQSFNGMVAHDLRGPLHGLSTLAGMVQQELGENQSTRARDWLTLIATQTRRLSDLVDQLLMLARAGQASLHLQPVALAELVRESLQTLALSLPADRLGAVLLAPLPTVAGDPALLRQVFVNLIGNALKFCRDNPAACVEVSAQRAPPGWVISVRDNGVGFDAARASALFTPFTRLHGAYFEGAGIGLVMARRIVERHGGRIWAESRPGGGATFSFSLVDAAA